MTITPMDIYNKEFDKARKGYNAEQVDIFLDEIVEAFEGLYKINISLKEKNEVLTEKLNNYRAIEAALNKTLNTAEATAKDIVNNATSKAEVTVKEAEIKAKQVVQEAEYNAQQMIKEAEHNVQNSVKEAELRTVQARREYEELKRQIGIYRNRMISILQAQLKSVADDYDLVLQENDNKHNHNDNDNDYKDNNKSGIAINDIQGMDSEDNEYQQIETNDTEDKSGITENYFNFFENTQESDNSYTLPENKQLDGEYEKTQEDSDDVLLNSLYQDLDQPETNDNSAESYNNPKDETLQLQTQPQVEDDYIQIDYNDPNTLMVESEMQAEQKQDSTGGTAKESFSLEDAFLELRRAAETYKNGNEDTLS